MQVNARNELVETEGFTNIENVKLGRNYPDLVKGNSNGGKDYAEVGEMLKSGKPESRELKKLANEVQALGPNDTLTFVDKTNLKNRITYRFGDKVE